MVAAIFGGVVGRHQVEVQCPECGKVRVVLARCQSEADRKSTLRCQECVSRGRRKGDQPVIMVPCRVCGAERSVVVRGGAEKTRSEAEAKPCQLCASLAAAEKRLSRVRLRDVTCPYCGEKRQIKLHPSETVERACMSCANKQRAERMALRNAGASAAAPCGELMLARHEGRCAYYETHWDCEHYEDCLNIAANRNWNGWRCQNDVSSVPVLESVPAVLGMGVSGVRGRFGGGE